MSLPDPAARAVSLLSGNVLAALLLVAVALPAQRREPRFELPATPHRYDDVRPELTGSLRGCGGAPVSAETVARQQRLRDHRAALGRVLFYETRLSKNGERSCSSCHEQAKGFSDGEARSKGFRGKRTRRNSMSIVNLAYHKGPLFWDGRAAELEQMVLMPIEDEIEMGHDVDEVLRMLRRDPDYVELFDRAFESRYISRERLGEALATFVRALVSHGSRYDDGLAKAEGDVHKPFTNFTASENRGKALFFGSEGKEESCASCHVGRAYGSCGSSFATVPQLFVHQGLRNNGLGHRGPLRDAGHAEVSGDPMHTRKFRAPSLRNVAVTGPYMHDGRFDDLEDVVLFYARRVRHDPHLDPLLKSRRRGGSWGGGGRSRTPMLAEPLSPGMFSSHGFPMNRRARQDLVAFLETLTDRAFLRDPRFSDPFVRRGGRRR